MNYPVNKPNLLSAATGTLATVMITAAPRNFDGYTTAQVAAQLLTLNDSATFAGANSGNVIWSAPVSKLQNYVGQTLQMQVVTSNGLVVSAVPAWYCVHGELLTLLASWCEQNDRESPKRGEQHDALSDTEVSATTGTEA